MNIQTAHPSKFLKAADLNGQTVRVTIGNVELEEVGQGREAENKPILYLQGKEKGIVLNVTNSNTIADVYGSETDNWVGRPLEIYPSETEFGGRMVACLRVRVPQQAVEQAAPAAMAETAPLPAVDVNEPPQLGDGDIPF